MCVVWSLVYLFTRSDCISMVHKQTQTQHVYININQATPTEIKLEIASVIHHHRCVRVKYNLFVECITPNKARFIVSPLKMAWRNIYCNFIDLCNVVSHQHDFMKNTHNLCVAFGDIFLLPALLSYLHLKILKIFFLFQWAERNLFLLFIKSILRKRFLNSFRNIFFVANKKWRKNVYMLCVAQSQIEFVQKHKNRDENWRSWLHFDVTPYLLNFL